MALQYGIITGNYFSADDDPDLAALSGTVEFIPDVEYFRLTDGTDGDDSALVHPERITATVDGATGKLTHDGQDFVRLIAAQDSTIAPQYWNYTVRHRLRTKGGAPVAVPDFPLGPRSSFTIELTSTAPVPVTSPAPPPPVTVVPPGVGGTGLSAYELALQQGFTGTLAQWLDSLRGEDGKDSIVPGPASLIPGPPGPAGSLSVGTVSTAAPEASAEARITGDAPVQVLHLTIPRGQPGADGKDSTVPGPPGKDSTVPGPPGKDSVVPGPPNTLSIGTVTTTAPGSAASATIVGDFPDQTLSLGIPQGAEGAASTVPGPPGKDSTVPGPPGKDSVVPGPPGKDSTVPGPPGPPNTLSIGTVTTGAAGSNATAAITGQAPNQTLDLSIPRGADAPTPAPTAKITAGPTAPANPAVGDIWLDTSA